MSSFPLFENLQVSTLMSCAITTPYSRVAILMVRHFSLRACQLSYCPVIRVHGTQIGRRNLHTIFQKLRQDDVNACDLTFLNGQRIMSLPAWYFPGR